MKIKLCLLISFTFALAAKANFEYIKSFRLDPQYQFWSPYPGTITVKYKEPQESSVTEWQASAIADDLIALNLIDLPSFTKVNYKVYPLIDLMQLSYTDGLVYFDFGNEDYKIWTYYGYSVLNNFELENAYEIKVSPRISRFKYEITDSDSHIKLPLVSRRVANLFFKDLYIGNLEKEAKGFWQKVFKSKKDITFTEGQKKALSLLSHGYLAISLPGACQAFKVKESDSGFNFMIDPELEAILNIHQGNYLFAFDNDDDETLNKKVKICQFELAKYLKSKNAQVKMIEIPNNTVKAADDYIFEFGPDAYAGLVENAISSEEFEEIYQPISIKEYFNANPEDIEWTFRKCSRKCILEYVEKAVESL